MLEEGVFSKQPSGSILHRLVRMGFWLPTNTSLLREIVGGDWFIANTVGCDMPGCKI